MHALTAKVFFFISVVVNVVLVCLSFLWAFWRWSVSTNACAYGKFHANVREYENVGLTCLSGSNRSLFLRRNDGCFAPLDYIFFSFLEEMVVTISSKTDECMLSDSSCRPNVLHHIGAPTFAVTFSRRAGLWYVAIKYNSIPIRCFVMLDDGITILDCENNDFDDSTLQ